MPSQSAAGNSSVTLLVPKKHHSALLGKGGANTKRVSTELGVQTAVPKADADSREVTLSGKADALPKAVALLESCVGFKLGTAPLVVVGVEVDKKRHGALIGAQAAVLKDIEAKSGGVGMTMPDRDSPSAVVSLEGNAAAVDSAIALIEKILGAKVKRVAGNASAAGAADVKSGAPPPAISTAGLSITSKNGVDLARISIAKSVQHKLIGTKGATAKRLSDAYDVRVRIPGPDEQSTDVTVQGAPAAVKLALADIAQILGATALTSEPLVTAYLGVARQSHGALIGSGGSTLRGIEASSGARVSVPKKDDANPPGGADVVTVEGTAKEIGAAKAAVEKILAMTVNVTYPKAGAGGGGGDAKVAAAPKIDLKSVKAEVLMFPDVSGQPGAGAFNRFLTVLRSATKTCDIAIYTLTDDRVSRVIEDLHNAGVAVRVLTEAGTVNDSGADILPLMKLGVPVKVDTSEFLMHHKFAVLDGVVAITGSFNWTRSACEGNNENILIVSDASLVNPFAKEFGRLWGAATTLTAGNAAKLCVKKAGH